MADQIDEIMATTQLNLAAFSMARGAKLVNWELSNGQAEFVLQCNGDKARFAFSSMEQNVNIQLYISSRNMLLDMIKRAR